MATTVQPTAATAATTRTTASTTGSPYLEGAFAPVRQEQTVADLPVSGTLPDHLDGRYLRIGPNPVSEPDAASYKWFFAEGMVHGLRLRNGKAEWYRNRWVRSANVTRQLGERRRTGPHGGGMDFAANTNIIHHAGRTFALVEGGARPYELTHHLDTVGPTDFDGTLRGAYTPHPKRDPATGELHGVAYSPFWGNVVRYTVTGVDGRVRRTVPIEVTGRPLLHDFALTEQHVVIWDLPVVADMSTLGRFGPLVARLGNRAAPQALESFLMRGSSSGRVNGQNVPQPFRWNPDYPARVGVMRRDGDGSDMRWFDVGPCFVFHSLNAYDDGDKVVVDVVRYPKLFATDFTGPADGSPTLDRWTIDLQAGNVHEERFDDRGQEFPRVDERRLTRRHRYGYITAVGGPATAIDPTDMLLRHDFVTGATDTRSFGPAARVSEFVFVPSGPDAAEDDGVLMGFVLDLESDTSDLVLVDAATLEDVARVHLPARVPAGLHGNWVPS